MTAVPVLDEKMRALLMKLRKGADASVSLPQVIKVLTLLGGWRIEEIVSLVPLHYEKSVNHDVMKFGLWREDEEGARRVYDELRALEVSRLPSNPKLGQFVVMELEPFTQKKSYRLFHGANYKLWVGVPGYRFTDPTGRVFELLPNRHDVFRGSSLGEQDQGLPTIDAKGLKKRLVTYDLMPWLKTETTYLDQVNEVLGTEPHEKGAPRTRENTGSCGACFENIKLEPSRSSDLPVMVLHGYKRPRTGHVEGRCPGENMPPYELSPAATKSELALLKSQYEHTLDYLTHLKDGSIDEFSVSDDGPIVRKSELPASVWEKELRNHQKRVDNQLQHLKAHKLVYEWLVKNWEKRPLPVPNVPAIQWLERAARELRKERAPARS